jgi:undecaprenyl-diphosphatase
VPFLIVANPSSGVGRHPDLARDAAERLTDARVLELTRGVDLGQEVAAAVAEGRVVVACGGDGTVNAVAGHLAGTEGVLGVLPGGTWNHFAKDLGVGEPEDAIAALARGEVGSVDVGRVDEDVFVNNVALGIYPFLVREREQHEDTLGKAAAYVVAAARVLSRFRPVPGTIDADGDRRSFVASVVFVGNNRYSTAPGAIGTRPRLDEGVLDVRVVRARGAWSERSRFALGAMRSAWERRFVGTTARHVTIDVEDAQPFAMDGEERDDAQHLDLRVEPKALRVVVPR